MLRGVSEVSNVDLQIYLSDDGGNSFQLVHALRTGQVINQVIFSRSHTIMRAQNGDLLYGKTGQLVRFKKKIV